MRNMAGSRLLSSAPRRLRLRPSLRARDARRGEAHAPPEPTRRGPGRPTAFPEVERRQQIAEEPIDEVARYLDLRLGTELTAYAVGLAPNEVADLARGSVDPGESAERRLRNLYAVAWFLVHRDGPGTAYQFLLEPNSEVQGRPPADALREGVAPREVWFAASAVY